MTEDEGKRRASVPMDRRRRPSAVSSKSTPTSTKSTRSRTSTMTSGSASTAAPQEAVESTRHPRSASTSTDGGELTSPPRARRTHAGSVATTVVPKSAEVTAATRRRGRTRARSRSASDSTLALPCTSKRPSHSFSTASSTAMSPPLPLSISGTASSSGSVLSNGGAAAAAAVTSPHTSPEPLPTVSSTLTSSLHDIHGGITQLYLTPITATLSPATQHAAFTAPHFNGRSASWRSGAVAAAAAATNAHAVTVAQEHVRGSPGGGGGGGGGAGSYRTPRTISSPDSGTWDTDESSSSRASQAPASAAVTTWTHSPSTIARQRGGEFRPRPSFALEPPLLSTVAPSPPQQQQQPPPLQSSLHVLSVPAAMPVLDVPSSKPAARQPPTPPPLANQRLQQLLALDEGQRGAWTLNSSWAPAGSPVSFGARSPPTVSSSRPSSRSSASDGSRRARLLQFAECEHTDGEERTTLASSGGDAAPQRRVSLGASTCSLSMASVATSLADEPPPPPPAPPAQLSLGGGGGSGAVPSPPQLPRVAPAAVVGSGLRERRDGGGGGGASSLLRTPSRVHSTDYAREDSTGGDSGADAGAVHSRRSGLASLTSWVNPGRLEPLTLSRPPTPPRPQRGGDGPAAYETRHHRATSHPPSSQYTSNAVSLHSSLLNVPGFMRVDSAADEYDAGETSVARAPPPLSLDQHTLVAGAGSASGESPAPPRPEPVAVEVVKVVSSPLLLQSAEPTTPLIAVAESSEKKEEDSSGGSAAARRGSVSGTSRTSLDSVLPQEPSLVIREAADVARQSKAEALSSRQQELAQSFRDRIQVGVRAPRRQPAAPRASSASRDRRRSNGASASSSDGSSGSGAPQRSGGGRRRGGSLRRSKGQTAPALHTGAALSFVTVAMTALACARLLRRVHALRARRHFDAVVAPAAAYRIQCKWRRYRQLCRVGMEGAVQLLVPWMRFRLRRRRHAKEASARLLQRVYRGEVVRSLHRFLHEQMRRNAALDVIRRYVCRWEAQNLFHGLQMQRDERAIVVHQCVQGCRQLFRAEQLAWADIVRGGVATLQSRPCVRLQDWADGVAALTGVVLDPRAANSVRAVGGGGGGGAGVAAVVVAHTSKRAVAAPLQEQLAALAQLEHQQQYHCSRTVATDEVSSSGATLTSWRRPSLLTPASMTSVDAAAATTAAPPEPRVSDDDVVAAYVQLLCRIEATERVEVERRLLAEHHSFLRRPLLLGKAIFYAAELRVPPLFSPLLLDMQTEVQLQQAAHLFEAEREARCAIIQLYESMPLACLVRPMLNPAADARHSDLVRLLNGVTDPWADAERSERRFHREVATYQRLGSRTNSVSKVNPGLPFTHTPGRSSLPVGGDDTNSVFSAGSAVPSFSTAAAPSHSTSTGAMSTPPLPSLQRPTKYAAPNLLRVRVHTASSTRNCTSSPVTTTLPAYATPLFLESSSASAATSFALGSSSSSSTNNNNSGDHQSNCSSASNFMRGRDEEDRHANSFLATLPRGRGDGESKTAIPSPHRRPRGPPLPLLRKLLPNPGRGRRGTSRPSLHPGPAAAGVVVAVPATAHGAEVEAPASGPRFVDTAPPSEQARVAAADDGGTGGGTHSYTNSLDAALADGGEAGATWPSVSPASAARHRFTAAAHATATALSSHTPWPSRSTGRVSVAISDHHPPHADTSDAATAEGDEVPQPPPHQQPHQQQPQQQLPHQQQQRASFVSSILASPGATVVPMLAMRRTTAAPPPPLAPSSMLHEAAVPQPRLSDSPTQTPERAAPPHPHSIILSLVGGHGFSLAATGAAPAVVVTVPAHHHPTAARSSIEYGHSLLYTSLSMHSDTRDDAVSEAEVEASTRDEDDTWCASVAQQQQQQQQHSFPPTPVLSPTAPAAMPATVVQRWAPASAAAPLQLPRRPPTPPPRQCHAASVHDVEGALDEHAVRSVSSAAALPADHARPTLRSPAAAPPSHGPQRRQTSTSGGGGLVKAARASPSRHAAAPHRLPSLPHL